MDVWWDSSVILMTKAFTAFMFCINYWHDVCVCLFSVGSYFMNRNLIFPWDLLIQGLGTWYFPLLCFVVSSAAGELTLLTTLKVRLTVLQHVPQCHSLHNPFQQECEWGDFSSRSRLSGSVGRLYCIFQNHRFCMEQQVKSICNARTLLNLTVTHWCLSSLLFPLFTF